MAKTALDLKSFANGYQQATCRFFEGVDGSLNPQASCGVPIHVYKTSSSQSVAMATSATKTGIAFMNPPGISTVHAKTNGIMMDYASTGKSFFGIHLCGGQLSMEGYVGLGQSAPESVELYKNYLYGATSGHAGSGWNKYYPTLCIKWDESVTVRWPRFEAYHSSTQDIITVPDICQTYNRAIGCGHCLVYKGRSVFDTVNPVISAEGIRCGNWDTASSYSDTCHFNGNIGESSHKIRCRRTLLGHHKDGYFLLIVVEGNYSTSSTKRGMNLMECAWMLQEMGCDYGMNMDGSTPTQMRVDGSVKYGDVFNVGTCVCAYDKT